MAFRSKSAERALAEIHHLRERYGARMVSVVDNILDMRYFRTLLPLLAEEELELSFFYEVKANLTLDQVRTLASAGVRRIQPGIESFSDNVLALMRKGTTALQNVQLLKWCRELEVIPEWNLLYGFPGERPADYEEMLPLLDAIDFLDPPGACGPVRLDRFSPYHADPAAFGMHRVEPLEAYRHLYPVEPEALKRIAYYFDFQYADRRVPLEYAGPVLERVQRWMDEGPNGGLWLTGAGTQALALVRDRVGTARETVQLEGWQAQAYVACDSACSLAALMRLSRLQAVGERTVRSFLDWCVWHQLMITRGGRYLALGVHAPPRTAPPPARPHATAVGIG
jgi:ribosomal peptide maturation radical SAM protein 1